MDKINIADYLLVPGGEFIFGTNEPMYDSEHEMSPQLTVNLPSFRIKRTVVTVKEWRDFLNDSQYAWDEWAEVALASPTDNHPMVCVNWYDAKAYCKWGSKVLSKCMRLPTEFEWEKACRGNHGQLYPAEIDGKYDEKAYAWDEEKEVAGVYINRIVGRDPTRKTPYGCLDVWESISEWCENWYVEELSEKFELYNGDVEKVFAETDAELPYKVFRGGGYLSKGQPRCTMRGFIKPSFKNITIGFRPVICSERNLDNFEAV